MNNCQDGQLQSVKNLLTFIKLVTFQVELHILTRSLDKIEKQQSKCRN